ncbi:hypothetical protein RF11_04533 [Thelohanellus kitauei]|uniref:Uncharacterized protein n=1 Tax=Thelohanellus kitauei TaxID=669202 RepID=A0A0C2IQE0_THEKT|nr:hypothetical protein RF11_04533 [Thelohanellus kitauei]
MQFIVTKIPCVYVLIKNKTLDSYTYVLRKLAEDLVLRAQTSLSDSDKVAITSFHSVFPEVNINLTSQKAVLASDYSNNPNIRNHLKILGSLTVETHRVIEYFEVLEDEIER